MAIVYGVTPQGFVAKPMSQITSEIDTGLQGILGASAGTEPDGTIPLQGSAGQMKTFLSDGFGAMWDLQQASYSAFDPGINVDEAQDAVAAITGTTRLAASFSSVEATCTGDPGTVLQPGRVATVTTAGSRFDSQDVATIAALTSWAGSTGYSVGDRRTNASRAYVCITAGTSAGSGGPTTTSSDITDGSVHWRYMGDGTGAVDTLFEAEVTGPIGADSGQLATIATPVQGWKGVINLLDATLGSLLETNTAFRIRRNNELTSDEKAVVDAIRGAILRVNEGSTDLANHAPVTSCTVFYNSSNVIDGNGLPPHSVEILVLGAPDADIAAAIWQVVGGGIETFGTTSTTTLDSQGNPQPVSFSRPDVEPIYIVVNAVYDPKVFPTDTVAGANLIKDALALFGSGYLVGESVRSSILSAQVFDGPTSVGGSPVPGVIDVPSLYIGLAPSPGSSATIPITNMQLATFDTSRIVVNLTPGTP